MIKTQSVLDKGYVELIDKMGSDSRIIETARISHRSEGTEESNKALIKLLIDKGHKTPFEHCVFTFKVKAPIFVVRQWMRHRIGSFNEVSARYTEMQDFYVPSVDRVNVPKPESTVKVLGGHMNLMHRMYLELLSYGLAKEVARMILPVSMYTEFYWTVNLSSLLNFLSLRLDTHAQKEIQAYAMVIHDILKETNPMVYDNLKLKDEKLCPDNCIEDKLVEKDSSSPWMCITPREEWKPSTDFDKTVNVGDVLLDNERKAYAKVIMPDGKEFDGTSCIEITPYEGAGVGIHRFDDDLDNDDLDNDDRGVCARMLGDD